MSILSSLFLLVFQPWGTLSTELDPDELIHYAYVDEQGDIIFDGKNLGPGKFPILDASNIIFQREKNDPYRVHVYLNDQDLGLIDQSKSLGERQLPLIKDSHVGFFRKTGDNYHAIIDGKDVGICALYSLRLSMNNWACERPMEDNMQHIIYNGKDLGEGYNVQLSADNIVYQTTPLNAENSHIIYNGKDLGLGEFAQLDNENIVYLRQREVIFNGESFGLYSRRQPILYDGHVVFSSSNNRIMYDRKVIGTGYTHVAVVGSDVLWKDDAYGLFLNGKKIGIGYRPQLIDGHYAFESRNEEGASVLNYDGKIQENCSSSSKDSAVRYRLWGNSLMCTNKDNDLFLNGKKIAKNVGQFDLSGEKKNQ